MQEPRIRTSLNRAPSGPTSHAEMRAWAAAAYHRGKGDDCWVAIYLGDVRSPVDRAILDGMGAGQYGRRVE